MPQTNSMKAVLNGRQLKKPQFQWTKQWYPIAVPEYLDPTRPHSITLLGRSIVIWNDGKTVQPPKKFGLFKRAKQKHIGKWRAFVDACPHRKAPLSEGRVEDSGELLCSYHAWSFSPEGHCLAIPQAPQHKEKSFRANPKASCNAMPTIEIDGLLWVWPDTSPDAALEAFAFESAPTGTHTPDTLRSPALIPELHDPSFEGRVKMLPWNTRELPYGWDFFCENVMDLAHVPVSHHGITGNRYTDAKELRLSLIRPVTTNGGFKYRTHDGILGSGCTTEFLPPSLVKITVDYPDGGKWILALYAVPTRPGYCRHHGCQILIKNSDGRYPHGLKEFARPIPRWLLHISASLFLHQDASVLHHQEKILAEEGFIAQSGSTDSYAQHVYTPISSDKSLLAFRQWLRSRAGGGVPWPHGVDPMPPRSRNGVDVYDVYRTHVKDCVHCQGALKNLQRARVGAFTTSAVFVAMRPQLGLLGAISGAAIAIGSGVALSKLIGMFFSEYFSHA